MNEQRSTAFIVVAGLPGAGKTTFIRTISEGHTPAPYEATARQVIDGYQMAYDYGQIVVDDSLLVRLLAPSASRDQKLARQLPKDTLGVIILVDSADRAQFPAAQDLIGGYRTLANVPFVIGATQQDLPDALPPDELRRNLGGLNGVPVIPCVATDLDSVTAVVIQLMHVLIDAIEAAVRAEGPDDSLADEPAEHPHED